MSVKAWHKSEAGLAGVKGSSLYALLCGWDQGPRSLSKTQSQQQSWAEAQISGGHSWALSVALLSAAQERAASLERPGYCEREEVGVGGRR